MRFTLTVSSPGTAETITTSTSTPQTAMRAGSHSFGVGPQSYT